MNLIQFFGQDINSALMALQDTSWTQATQQVKW